MQVLEAAELVDDTGDGDVTGTRDGAVATTFVPHFGQNFCVALSVK